MRRLLVSVIVIGSFLWTTTGVAVLVVALHEQSHHAAAHDHHNVFQVALHGHAHEGTPAHDHVVYAPLGLSRAADAGPSANLAADVATPVDDPRRDAMATPCFADRDIAQGPPMYLMHCVLLT